MSRSGELSLSHLRELYANGINLSQWLREYWGQADSDERIIELAYDLQAGTYVAAMDDPEFAARKHAYGAAIASEIRQLGSVRSLLEAGVGEATTLSCIQSELPQGLPVFGFDLSWSRLNVARRWLSSLGQGADLCCASLSQVPADDHAFDVVLTSHTLEPNRGREDVLLRELYRVTGRYLILLEPGYELASAEARQRMDHHRYCRALPQTAKALGYKVLEHRLFDHSANPLNPTALTIIEKSADYADNPPRWGCPVSRGVLRPIENTLYSPQSGLAYPVLQGIPCLRAAQGVIASHLG
ncbi:hypothetical protein BVH01_14695 [Pseudomonas sp. PA1(2017)]|uniref:methyltransferase domain-containing protein n=1 Tax=Pseudomonas sp. PA1(2017) TaxID=1932113 RepID=UPI00095A4B12|nr:methyltransferase domain-containing protein [Pseudomonas sp. PA1(2017)]OLU15092.1 hypothetical protein BVH01_14695 [Pseudomonas sp. PA1(2017)]